MMLWGQYRLQDAVSPLMEQLVFFHDHAILILVLICSLITYALMALVVSSFTCRYILDGQAIETLWTLAPSVLLIFLAIPSLRLLYLVDEVNDPVLTIKTVGHQWYWTYEYADFVNAEFASYILEEGGLGYGEFRLLDVDNRVVLPYNITIRLLATSYDVIHSWTIPALGVKVDAIPGRLNQVTFFINQPGLYWGQCSEICGTNHSFIPIVIEAVDITFFLDWVTYLNSSSC